MKILKTKIATAIFAIVALFTGFLFLNQSLTGNAIIKNTFPIQPLSVIGLLLVLCAIVLGIYTIRR